MQGQKKILIFRSHKPKSVSLQSPWSFQRLNCSSAWRTIFQNHFWPLFFLLYLSHCMASIKLPDWTLLLDALFVVSIYDSVSASGLLCVWHSFSCCTNYTRVFHSYEFSRFWVRTADNCVALVAFWDTQHELQGCIIFLFLYHNFLWILRMNCCFMHLKPSIGNFCEFVHPYRLFTSQYMRYEESLFAS